MVHYDVLLSYPNETNANYISIMDEHGIEVMWNCWYFLYLLTPVVYANWDVGSSKNGNWLIVQWDSFFFFLEKLISEKLIISVSTVLGTVPSLKARMKPRNRILFALSKARQMWNMLF